MATQQTIAVERYRRPRGQHPRPRHDVEKKTVGQLLEYLEAPVIDALIWATSDPWASTRSAYTLGNFFRRGNRGVRMIVAAQRSL